MLPLALVAIACGRDTCSPSPRRCSLSHVGVVVGGEDVLNERGKEPEDALLLEEEQHHPRDEVHPLPGKTV